MKRIRDRPEKQKRKFKRDQRGLISVFILLVLLPTIMFTSIMVDWARFNMAHAQLRNAAYLTAGSALAFYDGLLLEVYGLLAMSQDRQNMETFSTEAARMAVGLNASGAPLHNTFNLLGNMTLDVNMGADDPRYSLENVVYLQYQLMEYMRLRLVMSFFHMDNVIQELQEELDESEGDATQDPEHAENELDFLSDEFLDAVYKLYELHNHYYYIVYYIDNFAGKMEELNTLREETLSAIASKYEEIRELLDKFADEVHAYVEEHIRFETELAIYEIELAIYLVDRAIYEVARQAYNNWQPEFDEEGNQLNNPPSTPSPPTAPTPPEPVTLPTPVLPVDEIYALYAEIYELTYAFDELLEEMVDLLERIVERTEEADDLGVEIRNELIDIMSDLQDRRGVDLSEAFVDEVLSDINEIVNGGYAYSDDGDNPTWVEPLIIPTPILYAATEFGVENLELILNGDIFTGMLVNGAGGPFDLEQIRENTVTQRELLQNFSWSLEDGNDIGTFETLKGEPSPEIVLFPFDAEYRAHLDEILGREQMDEEELDNELGAAGVDRSTSPRSFWQQIRDAVDPAGVLHSTNIEGLPNLQGVNLPQMRVRFSEGLENQVVDEVMARIFTAEYGVQMFTNLVTNRRMIEQNNSLTVANDERMLSGIPFNTNINYAFGGELEFIFAGREDIHESLEITIRWMYGVLAARNFLYTFESPALRNEIRKIRAIPKIGFILAELYRIIIVNEETRIDLHTVLNGARTPLRKNPRARTMPNRGAEWRTGIFYVGLDNAWGTSLISPGGHRVPQKIGRGMYYYQWLRVMIMVGNSPAETTRRIGHLIQTNLDHHLSLQGNGNNFDLRQAFVVAEANLTARVPHFFINIGPRYREFNVTAVRGY